jgi:hypothetical protein
VTAYCSVADVRSVLAPALLDGGGNPFPDTTQETAAQLIDAQLLEAIVRASGRVDTYLRARYQMPPVPVVAAQQTTEPHTDAVYPDVVRYWTRDLAAFDATLTLLRGLPIGPDSPVRLRQAQAVAELAAARDGKLDAGLPQPDDATTQEGFAGVVDAGGAGMFGPSDWGDQPTGIPVAADPYGWPW